MRRTPLTRSLSALLALWFALGVVDAGALHRCPAHDPATGGASPAGSAEHGARHATSHASHQSHQAPADDSGQPGREDQRDGHGSHGCTCLGTCGVTAAIGVPSVGLEPFVTVAAQGRPAVFVSRLVERSASSWLFPPATAPPLGRVA